MCSIGGSLLNPLFTKYKPTAQSVQGRYYYKKIHHDKFILFGLEWVNVIDLSQKWASSREKVGKIIFFFKIFPIFFVNFGTFDQHFDLFYGTLGNKTILNMSNTSNFCIQIVFVLQTAHFEP